MSESTQQIHLIKWFKLQYPGKIIFSIPNALKLGSRAGNKYAMLRNLKNEGLLKGVSDLFVPIPRGNYHGLFIELKNIGKTRCSVSEDQRWFIDEMRESGYRAEWAPGFDKAKEIITEYMKGR